MCLWSVSAVGVITVNFSIMVGQHPHHGVRRRTVAGRLLPLSRCRLPCLLACTEASARLVGRPSSPATPARSKQLWGLSRSSPMHQREASKERFQEIAAWPAGFPPPQLSCRLSPRGAFRPLATDSLASPSRSQRGTRVSRRVVGAAAAAVAAAALAWPSDLTRR
jgi:4-amino-4-deoxy-L-arabinose transferase-like glycosyltransferase